MAMGQIYLYNEADHLISMGSLVRVVGALVALNIIAAGVVMGVPGVASVGPPDHAAVGDDNPGVGPPANVPPVDAPPVNAPPHDAPPVNAPPHDTPPVDAPPVNAPPGDGPPDHAAVND